VPVPVGPSYPSGHTLTAAAVYGTLVLLLSRGTWHARLAVFVAGMLVLAVGLSRSVLGVHWPTDVFGGLLAGLCVVQAVAEWQRLDPRWRR
jgi:undecaprenyl-diphosphatase